ncbi:MAG: SLBB domain-containing protein [Thermodesulfobacteriota bacterium]
MKTVTKNSAVLVFTLITLFLAFQIFPAKALGADIEDLLDNKQILQDMRNSAEKDTQRIQESEEDKSEKQDSKEKAKKMRNATATSERPPQASSLEKSYRLQYGNILMEQLIRLEDYPYRESRKYRQNLLEDLLENRKQMLDKNQTLATAQNATLLPNRKSSNNTIGQYYPYIPKLKNRTSPIDLERIVNTQLSQFGYDFFEDVFPEYQRNLVPSENYRLTPGDQLQIRIWGNEKEIDYTAEIQPDGTLNIPELGVISLAGVKYGNLNKVIAKEAKKYLQGINVSALLKQLSDLQVFVTGYVENPGLHTVQPFSSLIGALSYTGGVSKKGSLRNIQLYRNGTLHKELDMYDLIQEGQRDSDVILQDKDVIFVPAIDHTFAVTGAVVNPGIYEFDSGQKEKISIHKALQMANGALPQVGSHIYVRHYDKNNKMQVREIPMQEEELKKRKIKPGSLIELRYSSSGITSSVKLRGHVWEQKELSHRSDLKLSDVLRDPKNIKPGAITDYAVIKRYNASSAEFTTIKFPLEKVFKDEFDKKLQESDRIRILSKEDFGRTQPVFISGAVWKPGKYEFESNMTIEGLLAKAGGLKFGANTDKINITSKQKSNGKVINKQRKIDLAAKDKIELQPYDSVTIPQMKDSQTINTFEITGEVNNPGNYTITDNLYVSDIIRKAGGFTDQAYFYGAEYTSEDAREIQQKSIDKMIQKLQIQLRQNMANQAQTAVSQEAIQASKANVAAAQEIIQELKQIKAQGRIAFRLCSLDDFQGSRFDFQVEDGDSLHIPKKPNFVSVVGSVYSPSSYLYEDGTVDTYLSKSGGVTERGDRDHIYVLKANGEVVSAPSIDAWFSDIYDVKLKPGDTVVVPEDLERFPYLRMVKDVTDIVFKIATTAGVALSLNN